MRLAICLLLLLSLSFFVSTLAVDRSDEDYGFDDGDMSSSEYADDSSPVIDNEGVDDDVDIESPKDEDVKIDPIRYVTPRKPEGSYYFAESFYDNSGLHKIWIVSAAKKEGVEESLSKYDGTWEIAECDKPVLTNDYGLILRSKAHHHAVSSRLDKPYTFAQEKPLIIQYDIKFQNGQECGGAYIKLLTEPAAQNLREFNDKTPYSIMFGPDRCGLNQKVHFITKFKNPKSGKVEEKHAKQPDKIDDGFFKDAKTHLFTLIVNPDGSYEIKVDQKKLFKGNLLKDMEPPFGPEKEISDPDDKKPTDWDEREKIPDPEAKKPDDWDETLPEMIDDPNDKMPEGWLEEEPDYIPDEKAVKPDDWDEEMDGKYEPPLIKNPKCEAAPGCGKWKPKQIKNPEYKGKWKAPMIKNPDYKGKWEPKKIENPEYFDDTNVFSMLTPFNAVGLELWSMSEGIVFDDFLITDDPMVAETWAKETWRAKVHAETHLIKQGSFFQGLIDAANDKPWLWAIYILVILIPIVLITVFCCTGGAPKDDADAKKTDEALPDDMEGGEEEDEDEERLEEEESEEGGLRQRKVESSPKKTRKSDLEQSDSDEGAKASDSGSSPKRRARRD